MLLCLALQILQCHCRCKADAKHIQNAECRMHCRLQMQNADFIAELQIRKHSVEISNGLRARSAGPDLIQDAMRRGTASHPSKPALANRGIRSWRLPGLRSKREKLRGLSCNILECSGKGRHVLEYLGMLLDVLQSAPGRPPGLLRSMEI